MFLIEAKLFSIAMKKGSRLILLKADDYHYRRLYLAKRFTFFKSIIFRKKFFLATLIHFLLLLLATFIPSSPEKPINIKITLQKPRKSYVQEIDSFQKNQKLQPKKEEKSLSSQEKKIEEPLHHPVTQEAKQKPRTESLTLLKKDNFQDDFEKTLLASRSSDIEKNDIFEAPSEHTKNQQDWQDDNHAKQDSILQDQNTGKKQNNSSKNSNLRWQAGISRQAIYIPTMPYPEYYRSKGIQAKGTFAIEIDAHGAVISVVTLKSTGYSALDIEAKNALRSARFSSIEDTKRIDRGEMDVEFKLR